MTTDFDSDLLPEDPTADAEAEDDAISRLESAMEETDESAGGESPEPSPRRRRAKKRPIPENLGEPVLVTSGHLKLVSLGKSIANVTITLGIDLDVPVDIRGLLGEHAYAASFDGNYLGNGIFIKDAPLSVDVENNVHQKLKIHMPRFDESTDQVAAYVAPLLSDPGALSRALLGLNEGWRLNINVDQPGTLQLFQMQQAFDLTSKAE